MGSRYPNEFRMEVLKEVHAKELSILEISQAYKVSRGTIYTWLEDEQKNRLFDDNRNKTGRQLSINSEAIIQYIQENPDAFQYEVAKVFNVSRESVRRILKSYGFNRKKKRRNTKKQT